MGKALEEMTLEELWELFPIRLTEHREEWALWFEEEKASLTALLPAPARIRHIGSTSVDGIWAKPIVDILAELESPEAMQRSKEALLKNGWRCMSESKGRISLNKGYTEEGFAEKVFHLHLRLYGDADEILFRDQLRAHPEEAKEYEALKLSLWKKYEHDRDGYSEAKTEFILRCLQKEKKETARKKGPGPDGRSI